MGPKGAVEIMYRGDRGDTAMSEARTEEYRGKFANPCVAASRGYLDDIIKPRNTRRRICRALAMLLDKQLEHPRTTPGNIPLCPRRPVTLGHVQDHPDRQPRRAHPPRPPNPPTLRHTAPRPLLRTTPHPPSPPAAPTH